MSEIEVDLTANLNKVQNWLEGLKSKIINAFTNSMEYLFKKFDQEEYVELAKDEEFIIAIIDYLNSHKNSLENFIAECEFYDLESPNDFVKSNDPDGSLTATTLSKFGYRNAPADYDERVNIVTDDITKYAYFQALVESEYKNLYDFTYQSEDGILVKHSAR